MPEIKHRGVQGTTVVDDRTADFWLSHGWELADKDADTGMVLVFARSNNDATNAAREAGYTPKQWRFVDSPDDIATTPADPGRPRIVTDGFPEHPQHDAIVMAAVKAGYTDLSPAPAGD